MLNCRSEKESGFDKKKQSSGASRWPRRLCLFKSRQSTHYPYFLHFTLSTEKREKAERIREAKRSFFFSYEVVLFSNQNVV